MAGLSDDIGLDDLLSGGGGAGGAKLLPTPVNPAWYAPDDKSWYSERDLMALSKKEKQSKNLIACSMIVQYAPTNRSRCRRCGDGIEKDKLRLGYPYKYREVDPAYPIYVHPECYVPEVFGIKEKELRSKVFGFEALNNTERDRLWKAMRSMGRNNKASSEGKQAAKELNRGSVGPADDVPPPPPVDIPRQITVPMLPFQKEGLAWMCQQEETTVGGGVLADEMGMGKTIQAISLLLARKLKEPCLVVCPMAAVPQWVQEIEKFTTKDALRVMVYHGAQRARTAAEFKRSDVVITTYQTLENDYRKETNKQRMACPYCSKLFLPEKLKFHLKYFCGPDATRTQKQQKTRKKDKDAAQKAMVSMGIGQQSKSSSSSYTPPTITNIYKDYMKQAGVDVKAKGYWNVMREARERVLGENASSLPSSSSSASSSAPPALKSAEEDLSRERLGLLDKGELQDLCEKRGLDKQGRKGELIDRLMEVVVRGMGVGSAASAPKTAVLKAPKERGLGARLLAQVRERARASAKAKGKAKAKAKGKAKAKSQTAVSIKQLKVKKPDGSSGYRGVCYHKGSGKYQASALINGQMIYLGLFATELQAARAISEVLGEASSKDLVSAAQTQSVKLQKEVFVAPMKESKAKAKVSISQLQTTKRDGSSGYRGVTFHKRLGKYQALPTINGKATYLGVFDSEKQGARAVCKAMEEAGVSPNSGDSSKEQKGKKGAQAAASSVRDPDGPARTVANRKQGESSGAVAKGTKRKRGDDDGEAEAQTVPTKTFEGHQLDLAGSPLHAVFWGRIILDEAHRIKGRTNSTAMAAYALKAKAHKWCLTGTPLQNRIGELYSLIRFLRVRPFAFYYCKKKGCNCECAKFMRERYCPNCGHVRFMHYSHFKCKVSNPIIKFGYMGAGKTAFQTLRNDILNKTMLRRTKEERKADLQLPGIQITIRKDALSQQERDFYTSLYKNSCTQFNTYVQAGTILHNYAHIFDLLTSLRRAVDHPYLIVHGGNSKSHQLPDGSRLQEKLGDVCALCQEDIVEDDDEEPRRVAKCGHAFHDSCIRDYMTDAPKLRSGGIGCPACFAQLHVDLGDDAALDDNEDGDTVTPAKSIKAGGGSSPSSSSRAGRPRSKASPALASPVKGQRPAARSANAQPLLALPAPDAEPANKKACRPKAMPKKNIMNKVRAADFQSSTKIEALLEEVQKMRKSDPAAKAIVFSQFGGMLDIVEFRLKRAGISCVVFKGGMSMEARTEALAAFNSDPTLKVILISLKAGGEGLNLQIANHVFLLDPWWNPASELQAIQRAHRIGQTREVRAVRFITTDTIEEKIIKLQEKKQLVFDASIDGSAVSLSKLTEQDLRFLFQH